VEGSERLGTVVDAVVLYNCLGVVHASFQTIEASGHIDELPLDLGETGEDLIALCKVIGLWSHRK